MRGAMRIPAFALAMAAGAAAHAAERLPSFPKDTEYGQARRDLAGLGYRPVTMPEAQACTPGDGRCRGRPEMLACSGTGLGHCIFVWRAKSGSLIEIVTAGEQEAIVVSVRCRSGCR